MSTAASFSVQSIHIRDLTISLLGNRLMHQTIAMLGHEGK
jgi:hypothetical protein